MFKKLVLKFQEYIVKLGNFRKLKFQKSTVISTIIIIMVLLAFTLNGFLNKNSDDSSWALKIDNHYVSVREFEDIYRAFYKNYKMLKNEEELKRQLISKIALEKAMELEIQSYGYLVDDDFVLDFIKQNEDFAEDGKFSPHKFASFLKDKQISEASYIQDLKNSLIKDVAATGLENFTITSNYVASAIAYSRSEIRKGNIYTMNLDKIKFDRNYTKDDLYSFYNKNRILFKKPKEKFIRYIDAKVLYSKINYTPTPDNIARMRASYPQMKAKEAIQLFVNAYKCNMIENFAKDATRYGIGTMENIARVYDVEVQSENIVIKNDEKSMYVDNIAVNSVGLLKYGTKNCYDFKIVFVEKEKDPEYLPFDLVKKEITTEYIRNEKLKIAKERVENWNTNVVGNHLPGSFEKNLLNNLHFTETATFSVTRTQSGFDQKLLETIFTTDVNEFSKIIKIGDNYKVIQLKNIIQPPSIDKKLLAEVQSEVKQGKMSDLYYTYYMHLQDKYNIEINNNYFKTNVIK